MDKVKKMRIWLGWEYREVGGKKTKVPLQLNGKPASTTDPKTWSSYAAAKAKFKDKIGLVFEGRVIGIDLDHVIVDGQIIDPASQVLVDSWDSYIEYSPSGTGLHLLAFQTEQFEIKKKKHKVADTDKLVGVAYECYNSGRFFTFTDKPFDAFKQDMLEYDEAIFESHISKIGYPWGKDTDSTVPVVTTERIKENEEILDRMLSVDKYRKLLNLDDSEYNNGRSEADMGLMCGFAFYTHNNAEQMREMFLNCKRGERSKVSVRKDYLLRLVHDAVAYTKEFYDWRSDIVFHATKVVPLEEAIEESDDEEEDEKELMMGAKGPEINVENTFRFINKYLADCFRYESFSNKVQIRNGFKGAWRDFEDVDLIIVQATIQKMNKAFIKIKKEMVYDAIMLVANRNKVDVAMDWVDSLKWDGVNRIDTWGIKVFKLEDNNLNRVLCKNYLVGAVNRLIKPGCKFDTALVVEGKQGAGKSTALGVLGGDWYLETTIHMESKDMLVAMQGVWLIEFAEGGSLKKAEQEAIKALLSTRIDRFRKPYGRENGTYPRRCAIAMTTNHSEYLKDTTGNRRWLPVTVQEGENTDIAWLKENRDQLIAEAAVLAKAGYEYWMFPTKELEEAQQKRMIAGPFQDKIMEFMIPLLQSDDGVMGVLVETLVDDVIKLPAGQEYKRHSTLMEVTTILKNILKMEKKRVMIGGVQKNRWTPTEETKKVVDTLTQEVEAEQEF